MSAGPQLSESPAQPSGCRDVQLPEPCLPFPAPFPPFSPGRLKPDKKGQMRLPLDKSLQVSRELLGTHTQPPGPALGTIVQASCSSAGSIPRDAWEQGPGCFREREQPQRGSSSDCRCQVGALPVWLMVAFGNGVS